MYGETTSSSTATESLSWHGEGTVKQTQQQHWSWIRARLFQTTCKKFTDSLMTPPDQSRTCGLCALQKICCKRSVSEVIWIKPVPPASRWSGIAVWPDGVLMGTFICFFITTKMSYILTLLLPLFPKGCQHQSHYNTAARGNFFPLHTLFLQMILQREKELGYKNCW